MKSDQTGTGDAVAVIGAAIRTPGGDDLASFWDGLCEGRESIRRFSAKELEASGEQVDLIQNPDYVPARGVIQEPDFFDSAYFGYSRREALSIDPQHRVFLELCSESLEQAGYLNRCPTASGVFAGAATNHYQQECLANDGLRADLGDLQIALGNEPDFLTNRVSYKLGLRGPSVVIQTACSTSLVAVHMACNSLLTHECDLALAGGVSIRFPQVSGYLYRAGGILSRDGHCRAFDASATGTVSGNGAGVVVLKRLEDAHRDGDYIYAVVRGSAVNNDGSIKQSYTAPNVAAQAALVSEALAVAGLEPADIGYIECHGSGTTLGDPVEISALNRAFSGFDKLHGTVRIGSVKTNVGHLNTAAGIIGFIKAVLAVRHGLLPPSLHYADANPEIPFSDGPFMVNTTLHQWCEGERMRRAGVSAFGLGGTNAHVIVEQAPPLGRAAGNGHLSKTVCWLPLSADSGEALEKYGVDVSDTIEAAAGGPNPPDLADISYTLSARRPRRRVRRALRVASLDEARLKLRQRNDSRQQRSVVPALPAEMRSVVLLLSGLGDRHLGELAGLYETLPRFREIVDYCSEALQVELGDSVAQRIASPSVDADLLTDNEGALRQMLVRPPSRPHWEPGETAMVHCENFIVSFALARTLMDAGVKPRGLLGHSLGEYVAATLAGVFELSSALNLVLGRARLMEQTESLPMLAVALPASRLRDEWLTPGADLGLVAVNSPELCVVAGNPAMIDRLEQSMVGEGVAVRHARNHYAVHTPFMESVRGQLVALVNEFPRARPSLPFTSGCDGGWIRPERAISPEYWGDHLCSTARLDLGFAGVLGLDAPLALECGPGQTLSVLLRQQPGAQGCVEPLAIPLARPPHVLDSSDAEFLDAALARAWEAGVDFDLAEIGNHRRAGQTVVLPTHPMLRERLWAGNGICALSAASGDDSDTSPVSEARDPEPTPPPLSQLPTTGRASIAEPWTAQGETGIAAKLRAIWRRLLGIDELDGEADFFELGGHSLLAVQLVAAIEREFGVDFSLLELLRSRTMGRQSASIEALLESGRSDHVNLPEIDPDPKRWHEPFGLTEMQQAYWVGRSSDFELGDVATHGYFEIENDVPVAVFESAWQRLIDRHGMLRVVVDSEGKQRILSGPCEYSIQVEQLAAVSPSDRNARLSSLRQRMDRAVLDLEQWPLFEIVAAELDGGRWRYFCSFDLIAADAGSWQLVFAELAKLIAEPDLRLDPLSISFRDYQCTLDEMRTGAAYARSEAYWKKRIESLPPAPSLPLQTAPERIEKPRFDRRHGRLELSLWSRLADAARSRGLTPTACVLSAFSEVMTRWAAEPQFTLNLTLFNRLPLHPEIDQLMGDFSSLSLLQVDGSSPGSFEARSLALQAQLWRDLEHRQVGGISVLRQLARSRSLKPGALMPIVFTSTLGIGEPGEDASVLGRVAELGDIVYSITQTPQVWLDHQVFERSGALCFNWDFVDGLFRPGVVDEMFEAFNVLLRRLASDPESWDGNVTVPLPESAALARDARNATERRFPDVLVHEKYERNANLDSDSLAIITDGSAVSYGELNRRAESMSADLEALSVGQGACVGVCLPKGVEQVVAVIAVLKAGAAFVPLDSCAPDTRLKKMVADLGLPVVIADEDRTWPEGTRNLGCPLPRGGETAILHSTDRPAPASIGSENLAYVMFTSGTTGVPKAVGIEHRSVVNRLDDVLDRFNLSPTDRALAITPLHHDLAVFDILGMLSAGAGVVIPSDARPGDPEEWARLMTQHEVSIWNSVPAFFNMLLTYLEYAGGAVASAALGRLRLVVLSGDFIPLGLPERLRRLAPHCRFFAYGGPTETTIWDIGREVDRIDPDWASIPLGMPLANARYYVLDDQLSERPIWAEGELWAAGSGLARAYLNDRELTAERFVTHPVTGERVYRTGDRGRIRDDGEIEILGRIDHQLKISGVRVEAGEVERALTGHPDVEHAVVVSQGPVGEKMLVAHLVGNRRANAGMLREFLSERLPVAHVPRLFHWHERLPLTANGKVDRARLAVMCIEAESVDKSNLSGDELVNKVLEAAREVLEMPHLSATDDWLGFGATSIDMVRIANALETLTGVRPSMDLCYAQADARAVAAGLATLLPDSNSALTDIPVPLAPSVPTHAGVVVITDPDERERFIKARMGVRNDLRLEEAIDLEQVSNGVMSSGPARRSYRHFDLTPIEFHRLAGWLSLVTGDDSTEPPRYRYPSAGGLYPVQVYIYLKPARVRGMEPGVYYMNPALSRLIPVSRGRLLDRGAYSRLVNRPVFDEGAFAVFFIADLNAIAPMYGSHSEAFCFLEAGYMGQLLMESAPAYGLGLCPIGDLDFGSVRSLFALGEQHLLVHSVIGGIPTELSGSVGVAPGEVADDPVARVIDRIAALSPEDVRKLLKAAVPVNSKGEK